MELEVNLCIVVQKCKSDLAIIVVLLKFRALVVNPLL
jgi:hypothetical protein